MYNRIIEFLNKYDVLSENQYGFRNKYATYMAIIMFMEKVSEAIDKGEYVIGIFIDFSKAFDTIDHKILLDKLNYYGIRGTPLSWIKNYLENRSQRVKYNNVLSSSHYTNCGVPQGSILGPLLFLIYINDLSTISPIIYSLLYADDTSMFSIGKNLVEVQHNLSSHLSIMADWLKANKLSLNVKKTHYMVFAKRKYDISNVNVDIDGTPIEHVTCTKFLGVIIDENINWKKHVEYISNKISKGIGILHRCREYLCTKSLVNLYYAFVYPYMTYCIHVWGSTYTSNINCIIILQKRAIRIISRVPSRSHTNALFTRYSMLKLRQIYFYQVGIFMHKFYNDDLPDIFNNIFIKNEAIHDHMTRQSKMYHLPDVRTNVRKMSIYYQGAKLCNTLFQAVSFNCSGPTFKRHLKKYLLTEQENLYINMDHS